MQALLPMSLAACLLPVTSEADSCQQLSVTVTVTFTVTVTLLHMVYI